MDKIKRITHNAFINYFNTLRQIGQVKIQDKGKLAILYFFYFLKYRSDYLYDLVQDPNQASIGEWVINRERENELMAKFNSLLACLAKDSCFVKLLSSDRCVQNNQPTWIFPGTFTIFITNDDEDNDNNDTTVTSMIDNDAAVFDNTNLNPLIPN